LNQENKQVEKDFSVVLEQGEWRERERVALIDPKDGFFHRACFTRNIVSIGWCMAYMELFG
jgi:hypothetical protein